MKPPIWLGQPAGAPPLMPLDVEEPVGTEAPPEGVVVVGGWVAVVAGVVAVLVAGTVAVDDVAAGCVLVSAGWASVSPAGCAPPPQPPSAAARTIGIAMVQTSDRGIPAL